MVRWNYRVNENERGKLIECVRRSVWRKFDTHKLGHITARISQLAYILYTLHHTPITSCNFFSLSFHTIFRFVFFCHLHLLVLSQINKVVNNTFSVFLTVPRFAPPALALSLCVFTHTLNSLSIIQYTNNNRKDSVKNRPHKERTRWKKSSQRIFSTTKANERTNECMVSVVDDGELGTVGSKFVLKWRA